MPERTDIKVRSDLLVTWNWFATDCITDMMSAAAVGKIYRAEVYRGKAEKMVGEGGYGVIAEVVKEGNKNSPGACSR